MDCGSGAFRIGGGATAGLVGASGLGRDRAAAAAKLLGKPPGGGSGLSSITGWTKAGDAP